MPKIVVLLMGDPTEEEAVELDALRERGHGVSVVEPRFPECKPELAGGRPALIVVDGRRAPSHGRATAAWMASQAKFRTVPVLFLDAADRDMARVRKEVPRAQFASWVSLRSTAERLARKG